MLNDYSPSLKDPKVSGSLKTCNAISVYNEDSKTLIFLLEISCIQVTALYSSEALSTLSWTTIANISVHLKSIVSYRVFFFT